MNSFICPFSVQTSVTSRSNSSNISNRRWWPFSSFGISFLRNPCNTKHSIHCANLNWWQLAQNLVIPWIAFKPSGCSNNCLLCTGAIVQFQQWTLLVIVVSRCCTSNYPSYSIGRFITILASRKLQQSRIRWFSCTSRLISSRFISNLIEIQWIKFIARRQWFGRSYRFISIRWRFISITLWELIVERWIWQ